MFDKGRKPITLKQVDDEGKGLAVIATLNVLDKDNDITESGAFGTGQEAKILPAHDWMHVPLGKAFIREEGDLVLADFQMNLDIAAARDWHSALKFDLAQGTPLQECSYGFTITDATNETRNTDTRVRILKGLTVHEISPVVLGAGEGTGTVAIKSGQPDNTLAGELASTIEAVRSAVERCETVKALRLKDGRDLSPNRYNDLESLKASMDELIALGDQLQAIYKQVEAGEDIDPALAGQLFAQFHRNLTSGVR